MDHLNRRELLQRAGQLGVSAAGLMLLGGCGRAARALPGPETPPEVSTLRIAYTGSTCQAPQYVAEGLLRGEGFADVQYVNLSEFGPTGPAEGLGSGKADITMNFSGPLLSRIDEGDPIVFLAGGHVGCFELVASGRVRTIGDLRGKSVAMADERTSHVLFSTMVKPVGIDPKRDVKVVFPAPPEAIRLLQSGEIDAYLAFPPFAQELRAKQIGHVLIRTATDKPWSQYFCCLLAGNREFVQNNPAATRRAMRAILKSADLCAAHPEWAAQLLLDKGYVTQYDYALRAVQDLPYGQWREYDPEDTLRFYALRLQEEGMIKTSPNTILEKNTDWRFLNELKKELKV
jgi:NitT/TauT family transport system substrate-binding protein